MSDMKNGNRRAGAVAAGRVVPSGGRGIQGAVSLDVGKVIRSACLEFARIADWRHASHAASQGTDGESGGPGAGYRLSEDHEGLHSGRYINVGIVPAANAVSVKGGYYDAYWQPRTVYKESLPLKELTPRSLGCLLMEMHDRLCSADRAQAA